MKDTLLSKLISVLAYLSSCDLENDECLRYLYTQLCVIQGLILQYAVKIGFKKDEAFEDILIKLGIRK